jgi:fatty acid desaturase
VSADTLPDVIPEPLGTTSPAAHRTPPKRREYLTPFHATVNVLHVLATHGLLVTWFWLGHRLLPLFVYVPLSVLASLVHQRAMSEWLHEGAHWNLVANRRWNDRLTNGLAGFWFALPVRVYRAIHFAHHGKYDFFVPEDPDTAFLTVDSRRAFWLAVLRDVSGLTILRQVRRFEASDLVPGVELRARVVTIAVHLGILALCFETGRLDAALLYYGTLATLYPLLNRLRTYGQHVTLAQSGRSIFAGSRTSRTIDAGFIDRILHTSPRLMWHHEHHLYPNLPYRALKHVVSRQDEVNRYTRRRWATLRAMYEGLPPR